MCSCAPSIWRFKLLTTSPSDFFFFNSMSTWFCFKSRAFCKLFTTVIKLEIICKPIIVAAMRNGRALLPAHVLTISASVAKSVPSYSSPPSLASRMHLSTKSKKFSRNPLKSCERLAKGSSPYKFPAAMSSTTRFIIIKQSLLCNSIAVTPDEQPAAFDNNE